MDTGFIVWSFQGKLLYRSPRTMERFCQLVWRPRPPSLLSEEDLKVQYTNYTCTLLTCGNNYFTTFLYEFQSMWLIINQQEV